MSGGLATQGYTQKYLVSIIFATMRLKGFPYLGYKGIAMGIGIGISKGMSKGVSKDIGKGKSLGLGKSLGSTTNPYN